MEKLSNVLKEGAQFVGMTAFLTGVYTAAGAIVGGPMGASGGALFGFTATVLNKPIQWATRGLLKPQGIYEEAGVDGIAGIITIVASTALTYGVFKAVGMPLKRLFLLNLTAGAVFLASAFVAFAVGAVALIIIGIVNPQLCKNIVNSLGNSLNPNKLGHRTY